MCKYCTEYEDLPEHVIDGEPVGKVFDTCIQRDENGWHIELPSGNDIGIRYCPYCGRELYHATKIRNCSNCKHICTKICDDCVMGSGYSAPSHWEGEATNV